MNQAHLIFGYIFRLFPLILIGMNLLVYWWFRKWLFYWKNINIKKILFIYKILILIFIIPWFMMAYHGPKSLLIFPFWMKIIYIFPTYIWQLTHFVLFFILIPYYTAKSIPSVFHWIYNRLSKQTLTNSSPSVDLSKRNWLTQSAIAIPATIFSINTIGMYQSEFDHVITKIPITIKNLPDDLKGVTITQISDIHFGPFCGIERFAIFSQKVNELKSDIIAITGDIFHSSAQVIPIGLQALSALRAPYGVYACLGNHEYYTGVIQAKKGLEDIGITVLVDATKILQIRDQTIYLMGVDYPNPYSIANKDKLFKQHLNKTLKTAPKKEIPKILLAHHPNIFLEVKHHSIDLTLSGHTHGGQISFGELGGYKLSPGQLVYPYLKGYYKENNAQLYVNSGLGHWLPIRYNCPTEITQFILS